MHWNPCLQILKLNPSRIVRFIAGLGLVLVVSFVGSARADTVVFGFAARMGGTDRDFGRSIAVDDSGNVYITGHFRGTADFDPGAGTENFTSAGLEDIFITKLDSAGNLVWAKAMGGISGDFGVGIVVDASGNVYTTGTFSDTVDFDPGLGTANLTSAGGLGDIFVCKLDSTGNFMWAKAMGGTSGDNGRDIVVDASGNVYTTGFFVGTVDFDPGLGTVNLTSAGDKDIFIQKLNSAGNFLWAKAMGGTSVDSGHDIAVDASGNVYTTGPFQGTADFDPGAGTANLTSVGSQDIFVSKLDSAGDFVWAKAMGAAGADIGRGIVVDASGNVHTTGSFGGTADFDPGAGTANLSSVGDADVFVQKLNSAGNFVWAKAMGGTSVERGNDIAVDASGNVYTTGPFVGTADFNPGAGTANLVSAGSGDIFVSKLNSVGDFVWAKAMGGTQSDDGWSIAVDALGNVYTTGRFHGTADFDPGGGTANLSSAGQADIFVSKLLPQEVTFDLPAAAPWAVGFLALVLLVAGHAIVRHRGWC